MAMYIIASIMFVCFTYDHPGGAFGFGWQDEGFD